MDLFTEIYNVSIWTLVKAVLHAFMDYINKCYKHIVIVVVVKQKMVRSRRKLRFGNSLYSGRGYQKEVSFFGYLTNSSDF